MIVRQKIQMQDQLSITVVDADPDYLGIEILASSERFAGTTRIYAGLDEMSAFAERVAGFPKHAADQREYVLGSKDRRIAGGYCRLQFRCVNGSGHSIVELEIDDYASMYPQASCSFSMTVEPAELDLFCRSLKILEKNQRGKARLKRQGEPGATDNPDDAQRLREDH